MFCTVCNAKSKTFFKLSNYENLIFSIFPFSSGVFVHLYNNTTNIIQQKKAIRLLLNLYTAEAFISLVILPFATLCKYNVIKCIFYTIYNTNAFSEYFRRNYQVRNIHNLRNNIKTTCIFKNRFQRGQFDFPHKRQSELCFTL